MKIRDFQLERYFAEHEFSTPYLLCCSDCETFSISELLQLDPSFKDSFNNLELGYTESPGHPELRTEISRLYERTGPEDILVFSGAEEAIFAFMNVVLEPGDHLIVQFPAYQSLFEVAEAIGAEVTRLTLDEERGWDLDLERLQESIRPETKGIVVNFPHNPTGYLIDKERFLELARIASERGIVIFSDEVYRLLEQHEADRLPAMADIDDNSVSLGVMSKAFGLAGLRIGWVATKNAELRNRLASFKDYTTICASAPSECLATIALRHWEKLVERNKNIISGNLKLLDAFFRRHSSLFRWVRPRAGPIAFPRTLFTDDVKRFCDQLRLEKGVLLLPGSKYGFGNSHFRIGFGRKDMQEALARMEEFVGKIT
jgi:aspartate/methionine/tyrosine aminotransferase